MLLSTRVQAHEAAHEHARRHIRHICFLGALWQSALGLKLLLSCCPGRDPGASKLACSPAGYMAQDTVTICDADASYVFSDGLWLYRNRPHTVTWIDTDGAYPSFCYMVP